MYWINGIASELSLNCTQSSTRTKDKTFPRSLDIVSIQPSHHASLYITCTRSAIYLWSIKPSTVLSFVERSDQHIDEFGENLEALWKPDSSAIVVRTKKHYLLLYSVLPYDQRAFEFNFPHSPHAYVTGPGEGKGCKTILLKFRLAIRVDAGIICGTSSEDTLVIATQSPLAIQCISWNPRQINSTQTTMIDQIDIMETDEQISQLVYDKAMKISVWISNKGRAYFVQSGSLIANPHQAGDEPDLKSKISLPDAPSFKSKAEWIGVCFHQHETDKASVVSINPKFSTIAVGTSRGIVYVYSITSYAETPVLLHKLELISWASQRSSLSGADDSANSVQSVQWTSDGYALAVGFKKYGLAVWSVYGGLLCSSSEMDEMFDGERLKDAYVKRIQTLFWGPGNHQLYILSNYHELKTKLYTVPFAKLALTTHLHPDNARRGLIQTDDRILLYNNGGDYQENNTTIDPAAVAWSHIQYPALYITDHWPIRYTSISSDGKYIAIAGKRGFAHYNSISNRWKLFGNQQQEQSFLVQGGLVWYKHILIVGCELVQHKTYEIRLYSRDSNLDNAYVLCTEHLKAAPIYLTLSNQFLLVYTADNILSIFYICVGPTPSHSNNGRQGGLAALELIRKISLKDVVNHTLHLRSISLFHPVYGDQLRSIEHVISSNIVLLVNGQLSLLCPKPIDEDDDSDLSMDQFILQAHTQFDLHALHHQTEYYYIGRKHIENLITSLWIVDGKGLKTITNLLLSKDFDYTLLDNDLYEYEPSTPTTPGVMSSASSARNFDVGKPYSLGYRIDQELLSPSASMTDIETHVKWRIDNFEDLKSQSIYIPLDFYPLSILLDKGIIIGIEQNISYKDSLGFVFFKMSPKMHLFLHHILRYLLQRRLEEDAVAFARAYEKFVYFGHALEILLHTVLEEEAGHNLGDEAILPLVIKFLDQFPHALDVIVSCARKTEVALWDHLFSVVSTPKELFELCLADGRLRTATSYLIILQTMQPLAIGGKDTVHLLEKALDENDYELCKELLRFLSSIDNTGKTLQEALKMVKSRMEGTDLLSPHSKDAQIEQIAKSMSNLNSN
ncbi:RIC1-domain-containing protein [Blakeslea trispora]|nr:RIC1-domain-containing protein [Blakeslea trispora]